MPGDEKMKLVQNVKSSEYFSIRRGKRLMRTFPLYGRHKTSQEFFMSLKPIYDAFPKEVEKNPPRMNKDHCNGHWTCLQCFLIIRILDTYKGEKLQNWKERRVYCPRPSYLKYALFTKNRTCFPLEKSPAPSGSNFPPPREKSSGTHGYAGKLFMFRKSLG